MKLGNTNFLNNSKKEGKDSFVSPEQKQLSNNESEVKPSFSSLSPTSTQGVIIEEYMSITTIKTYPNGQKFIDTRAWFKGKKMMGKKKGKGKVKKQMKVEKVEEVESI